MGVQKTIITPGNSSLYVKKGDEIHLEYTGWLFDEDAEDNKGDQFDTSVGRGESIITIGRGLVLKGWDEGVIGSADSSPMMLGEKATLVITPDLAYGSRDLEIKAINGKRADST
ncbi:Peptidyl-prolyl cis-trans isomerase [Pyrenophora teres f. maculata]|nr:Peptidyl-prolyl cis-trans isomerase [Pyrenophora teres f. maculata]